MYEFIFCAFDLNERVSEDRRTSDLPDGKVENDYSLRWNAERNVPESLHTFKNQKDDFFSLMMVISPCSVTASQCNRKKG